MKRFWILASIGILEVLSLTGCPWHTHSKPEGPKTSSPNYQQSINLGRAIEYRPKRFSGREDRTDHPCLRGSYRHIYEINTAGLKEVWLCCVPIDELLSDSFHCSGDTLLPTIYRVRGADYAKIRSCHLEHPTSDERTIIPACIPAPFRAPDLEHER